MSKAWERKAENLVDELMRTTHGHSAEMVFLAFTSLAFTAAVTLSRTPGEFDALLAVYARMIPELKQQARADWIDIKTWRHWRSGGHALRRRVLPS